MGKKKYVFDSDSFKVGKAERKGRKVAVTVLKLFFASISLTVVYYVFFSLFFSTDKERALQNENRMLERMYPEMEKKAALLDDVVEGLKIRDGKIYSEIFETEAPDLDRVLDANLMPLTDSIAEEDIVKLTEAKADALMDGAARIEANMMRILELCSREDFSAPPMGLPLKDFSLSMTGASVGRKMNPFYKVIGNHEGIDFMSSLGNEVLATADGTVSETVRSRKGPGNVVVIDHGNGYVTKYAHLQDIEVQRGRSVSKGDVIGYVGMSGSSFAPHLHYEVWKDGRVCDPVNYFFGAVTPSDYAEMSVASVLTGQSLD